MGPNGCGQTTLLRTILGLLRPLHGEVKRQAGLTVSYVPQRDRIDTIVPLTARPTRQGRLLRGDPTLVADLRPAVCAHAAATTCRNPWYLDELFVTIQGQRQYVWRADTHTLLSHRSESCRSGVAPRVPWVPGLEVDAMFGNYGQSDEPVRVTT